MSEIVYEAELRPESRAGIVDGLVAFNQAQTGSKRPYETIGLVLKHPQSGAVDGGLTARIGLDWMFIELLFVPERLRGSGVGRALMERAEALARERGLTGIWLDTFSFQAPGFYAKLGYAVFGEIADFPAGHSRFFLHKYLS